MMKGKGSSGSVDGAGAVECVDFREYLKKAKGSTYLYWWGGVVPGEEYTYEDLLREQYPGADAHIAAIALSRFITDRRGVDVSVTMVKDKAKRMGLKG